MPLAILFNSKTKMLVAQKTEMSLADVQAMLEVAQEAEKTYGSCYIVIDYPTSDGQHVPWASMHSTYFDKHFEMTSDEYTKKFVPVKILAPATN